MQPARPQLQLRTLLYVARAAFVLRADFPFGREPDRLPARYYKPGLVPLVMAAHPAFICQEMNDCKDFR